MTRNSPLITVADFIRMRIAVFRQKPDQVFRRNAGDRSLVGPYPAREEAVADWQFALLSVAAYGRSNPERRPMPAGTAIGAIQHMVVETVMRTWKRTPVPTPNVDAQLEQAGWTRWSDFPDATLEKQMMKSHLRAEVWENVEQSAVVVAFGGTVFTSGKDWKSNLRWFIPHHTDEYTEIVNRFGPDFVKSFALRRQNPNMAYLARATIYSTGHSLGGGLAQQFAYSLKPHPDVPRVSEVYAFDPSPVTGYLTVDPTLRDSNKVGLQIGRIYERGEILAILRSFTSLIFKPSSVNPEIRGARFSLFYTWNSIAGHSIDELASKLRELAQAPP
jgi:hypothetical protein